MTNPESTAIDPVAAMGTDHTEAPAHPLHKVLSFVRRSGRWTIACSAHGTTMPAHICWILRPATCWTCAKASRSTARSWSPHGATIIRSLWKSAPGREKTWWQQPQPTRRRTSLL